MLVILAGGPVTAPVEAGLGEEAEAEVVMVYLVGEVPIAIAIGLGGGGLDEERAIVAYLIIRIIERVDVDGHSVSAVVSGGVLLSLLPHDVSMMVQSTRHISFLMLLVSLPGELVRDVDAVHADGVRSVSIVRDGPELIGVVRYVEFDFEIKITGGPVFSREEECAALQRQ